MTDPKVVGLQTEVARLRDALGTRAGWVSVEDGLPEEGRAVLVAGGCAIYSKGHWHSIMDTGTYRPQLITWEVRHWMHLPEPPEEP